jgi:hypothetical protein
MRVASRAQTHYFQSDLMLAGFFLSWRFAIETTGSVEMELLMLGA